MGSRIRENVRNMYECFCEVGRESSSGEIKILKKYPEHYNNEDELKEIPKFTFASQFENSLMQHYSFILTSADSKYSFCFCRYDPKTNSSLVILSYLPWHDTFYKLLNCAAAVFKSKDDLELISFLEACRKPPLPGHTLKVSYNAGQSIFECKCPDNTLPSILENYNLKEYFNALDTKCMIGLWAALLHERRIAVVATKLSRLSATVQAANTTLYPMAWQHIYIPILPKHLRDYLQAPMPYLIGVPRNVMENENIHEIGDVVILDADSKTLKTPFNDVESLPADVVSELKKSLSLKALSDDFISRAFLKAMVALIGSYMEAIRIGKGEKITFDPEAFVRTRKNLQPFLRKILQLQIFQQFIDERLDLLNSGRGFNDEFEVECCKYAERSGSVTGFHQYREWGRTVKREGGAILKQVKDKANPAVKSAVNTFRQGGNSMKSAVKGLKLRFPKKRHSKSSSRGNDYEDRLGSANDTTSSGSSLSLQSSKSSHSLNRGPDELPLDLLNELEVLLGPQALDSDKSASLSRQDPPSFGTAEHLQRSRTAPRPPARPPPPNRYAVVPTADLLSSAPPPPPPRPSQLARGKFISHITKTDVNGGSVFHTRPVQFADGTKSRKNKPVPKPNGVLTASLSVPLDKPPARQNNNVPLFEPVIKQLNTKLAPKEASGSVSDLIQLEDSSDPSLDDFDPLKSRTNPEQQKQQAADSALLQEYGASSRMPVASLRRR